MLNNLSLCNVSNNTDQPVNLAEIKEKPITQVLVHLTITFVMAILLLSCNPDTDHALAATSGCRGTTTIYVTAKKSLFQPSVTLRNPKYTVYFKNKYNGKISKKSYRPQYKITLKMGGKTYRTTMNSYGLKIKIKRGSSARITVSYSSAAAAKEAVNCVPSNAWKYEYQYTSFPSWYVSDYSKLESIE